MVLCDRAAISPSFAPLAVAGRSRKTRRLMLQTMLAMPIFTLARAMPTARVNQPP
jgi:hypothetical protein